MSRLSSRASRTSIAAAMLALAACGSFDVTNPNQPSADDLVSNPTRIKLAAAATGILVATRIDLTRFIWVVGAMGREGARLDGNNPPDWKEPFFGPMDPSGVGGGEWNLQYAAIRSANVYQAALKNVKPAELSAAEVSASVGFSQTFKALNLLYIAETRGPLGAPVDVDRPADAQPAPFVSEDSVYKTIESLLDSAATELAAGGAAFPFTLPAGFSAGPTDLTTPTGFLAFNRALKAKALVLHGTAGCAGCLAQALTALGSSFLDASPSSDLAAGAYMNYSNSSNDLANQLSEPIAGSSFFALDSVLKAEAQSKLSGGFDDRLTSKTFSRSDADGGLQSNGQSPVSRVKFTRYFTNGAPDPSAPIPLIRNEELILLRAEANIGTGAFGAAIADLDQIRTRSGGLAPTTLTAGSPKAALVAELLYNRLFSLLWEQGTAWIDARRYNLLGGIPAAVAGGNVPPVMLVPTSECNARGLGSPCTPPTP